MSDYNLDLHDRIRGLKDGEYLAVSRDEVWLAKKDNRKNGRLELISKIGRTATNINPNNYLPSTSIAISPKPTGIKNWSDQGEKSLKAHKRIEHRKAQDEKGQRALLSTVAFLISEDKNPIVKRVHGLNHDYKVICSQGYEMWIEIESKIRDRMVIKTGEVKFIKCPGDKELTKISLGAGTVLDKINL